MQKTEQKSPLSNWLIISIWASTAAFVAYFSMYGFRKPFSVAKFSGEHFLNTELELKTAIVISQILGYAISKYIGIWWCSNIKRQFIAVSLIVLILAALSSLLVFAIVPLHWKVVAIFFNGLPLGMVWGLVVRYLEGRRSSDVMLAVLCFSFMVASGVVKDVGKWFIEQQGVSESWMPFVTGVVFLPPFIIATIALSYLPQPTVEDVILRVERKSMNWSERWLFLRQFLGGLIPLFFVYTLLTAYRDFRDNYGIEMLETLNYAKEQAVFTQIEFPIALAILIGLGLLFLIQDNRTSLQVIFASMVAGAVVLLLANYLFVGDMITGKSWLVLTGLGAYVMYVPYNAVLFERMIAATGTVATAVFAIYVADAMGYSGSIAVQLYKDFFAGDSSRVKFFIDFTWILAAIALGNLLSSWIYFSYKTKPMERYVEPTEKI